MSHESGVQCALPYLANAKSHDPGHGPSHRQARARPEPGTMALAQDFVSQSHKKPGQSHGFEPKPSQNITRHTKTESSRGLSIYIRCGSGAEPSRMFAILSNGSCRYSRL